MYSLLSSLPRSLRRAILANADVRRLVSRHASHIKFLHRRLHPRRFMGLPLTLLSAAFLSALILLLGLVTDVFRSGPIVAVDVRLASRVSVLRRPSLTSFFLLVTFLGAWQITALFVLLVSLLWWLWGRRSSVWPLWLTVLGSQLLSALGKLILHRPRPTGLVPLYTEHSSAFPSGHATVAVALYGFLTYFGIRTCATWKGKILTFFFGSLLILLIGFSRLYLGVHYVSDVLGGYLVGFLWLLIGISLAEWRRTRIPDVRARVFRTTRMRAVISAMIVLLILMASATLVWSQYPHISPPRAL